MALLRISRWGFSLWACVGGVGMILAQLDPAQWPMPPAEQVEASLPKPAPPAPDVLGAQAQAPKPQDPAVECPEFGFWSTLKHSPFSGGRHNISHQRPSRPCRKVVLHEVEEAIEEMRGLVRDPDLFQLFKNCFPNTLDTAVRWRGVAAGTKDQELTWISTGDIDAMWLRDSANQLQAYKSLLRANTSTDSLASVFRGAINLQARYIRKATYCNAFRAPPEAARSLKHSQNGDASSGVGGGSSDFVKPFPPPDVVHECKWELDSLAAFLQLSHEYFAGTGDWRFFGRHGWAETVEIMLRAARDMMRGTYSDDKDADGLVIEPAYRFQRQTSTATETLANEGQGSPVRAGTGLVRSAFRPSDDATLFQLLVPSNMMLSRYLGLCAEIAKRLEKEEDRKEQPTRRNNKKRIPLSTRMANSAKSIRAGIEKHARVKHPVYGEMYAYEIDGSGSHSLMDDANLPSLLGVPLTGYVARSDPVYQNTRRFILSKDNPYYMRGSALSSVGGPHIGPGMAWPMSLIVRIMTTDDDDEIVDSLRQLVSTTDGLGLMHEAVHTSNPGIFTRPWFSWANGLFGQMLLDLKDRKPHVLSKTSFQDED